MIPGDKAERKFVLGWAIAIVVIASLPYLWGLSMSQGDCRFLGLTHNIDDGAVYLSWMRQAADGHFFITNLFTNEPQAARQFNALFLVMGGFARLTHLPLIWVYHLFRLGLAVALIFTIWRFGRLFLRTSETRRLLIPLVGLSGGIGWMFGSGGHLSPVDNWQPEANTFLSIYLNPLFLAGLILMIWTFHQLILAERLGRLRHAIYAGLCLLVLGNVHTYDVITIACVWAAYLVVFGVVNRRAPFKEIGLSVVAFAMAIPSVGYQFHLYQIDTVFRARANSPTPSPAIFWFLAGYGFVLAGAILGAVMVMRSEQRRDRPRTELTNSRLFVPVWAVVGFIVPYIPVAQQRKLVMGLHVPLCILCALAVTEFQRWLRASNPTLRITPVKVLFWVVVVASPMLFMLNDIKLLDHGLTVTHYQPFISRQELDAMSYLRTNSAPTDSILAPPTFSLFTPSMADRPVYVGHWSETPDYGDKLREWMVFIDPAAPESVRADILRSSKARYYISVGRDTLPSEAFQMAYLERVFTEGDVVVFRVKGNLPVFAMR